MAVPTFDLPLRVNPVTGGFAVLEQGSDADVANCVAVVLSTPVGSRIEAPDFGVPDLMFTEHVDTAALAAAITEWEPRCRADITTLVAAAGQETLLQVTATLTQTTT